MYAIDLSGKHALVMGVANHRSLSWGIAQTLHQAGASLCLTYAGERLKSMVEELAGGGGGGTPVGPAVVPDGVDLDAVEARRAELVARYLKPAGERPAG